MRLMDMITKLMYVTRDHLKNERCLMKRRAEGAKFDTVQAYPQQSRVRKGKARVGGTKQVALFLICREIRCHTEYSEMSGSGRLHCP